MKRISEEIIKKIIKKLENQEKNVDIAKEMNLSISSVERINECKSYTNFHNYKYNIRKESSSKQERKRVVNEYIEKEDYYLLHIINLKNEEVYTKIDKEDYERVSNYKWSLKKEKYGERITSNDRKLEKQYLHQFILGKAEGKVIDHINRDPLDNRKSNLRHTTPSINSTNARARTESKTNIRGVYYRKARPGIAKESWICEWSENGSRHSKSFSIVKYGNDEAFRLATELREQKLKEMKI